MGATGGLRTSHEYQTLAAQWNPTEFNPEEWLDLAQEAGMEYLCVTSKHHDGFCQLYGLYEIVRTVLFSGRDRHRQCCPRRLWC